MITRHAAATASDYSSVTETWGLPATPEQMAMQYSRYRLAGDLSIGGSVLEVGCGTGMGLAYLRERAATVYGGDYTAALLREARQHVPSVPVARLDAHHLPFPDNCFDVVLMLEMIYYLADLHRALGEVRRVLRTMGSLLVCLPNRDRPDFNPSQFAQGYPNVPELAQALERAGFAPTLMGGFPIEAASARERALGPLRHAAVTFRLIPRSMRLKSLVKRLLYGPLPRLGQVRVGIAYTPPETLDASKPTDRYKTLYAIGVAR